MQFDLHKIELPWIDDEGEHESSAVLELTGAAENALTGNSLLAMTSLRKLAYAARGELVAITDWRKDSGVDRRRWKETFESLVQRSFITVEGDYVRAV